MRNIFRNSVALVALSLVWMTGTAATVYNFDTCQSANSSYCDGEGGDGYSALSLSVDGNSFTFTHDGSEGSVHEIYFDFGFEVDPQYITINQTSVNYSMENVAPATAPDMNGTGFLVSFAVDAQGSGSDALGGSDGLGEALQIVFADSLSITDWVTAIHVGGLDGKFDRSDTFTSVVPLPAAVWLFGSALLGLFAFLGFRRRNKASDI